MAENVFQNRDRILAKMRDMSPKLVKKGAKTAVRKAANIVMKAARVNALRIDDRETAEQIAKNIAAQFQSRRSRREGAIVYAVGVRGGARYSGRGGAVGSAGGSKSNPGGDTWYWRFVELGTSRSRAQPFMLPALKSNADRAMQVMATELDNEITKLAAQI